jgi:heterodisulfide reductase subunit B
MHPRLLLVATPVSPIGTLGRRDRGALRKAQIKKIIESAYDYGAEMIVTPCPVCQMNVEVYQGQINKKYNTKFKIPVVYYSQLMAVAYGASAKEAGLDGNIVRATKLEEIAAKK